MSSSDNKNHYQNPQQAAKLYHPNRLTNSCARGSLAPLLKAPKLWYKLCYNDHADDDGVSSKVDIVQRNRGSEAMMPSGIFSSYLRRVHERDIVDEVGSEAEDVDGWEIDGCTGGG